MIGNGVWLHPIRCMSEISKDPILVQQKKQLKSLNGIVCSWIRVFMKKLLLLTPYWWIFSQNVIIDDKDPAWQKNMKDKISPKKILIKSKNFIELQSLALHISEMISIRKNEYCNHLSKKLNNPNTSVKIYWSMLKVTL